MSIVEDDADRWRFIKALYLLNDSYSNRNWHRETSGLALFERPSHWPGRRPLVSILAWTLMPNHFHLLLQEKEEGGIAKFMQRFCGSMSLCFNLKYESKGSLFQGAYKAKLVDEDAYLRYLAFYIEAKNVLELYPGGLMAAYKNFEDAWKWALSYPFSSFSSYVEGGELSPILDDKDGLMVEIHKNLSKKDVHELLKSYIEKSDAWSGRLGELSME